MCHMRYGTYGVLHALLVTNPNQNQWACCIDAILSG
jgi:hypothetical protein